MPLNPTQTDGMFKSIVLKDTVLAARSQKMLKSGAQTSDQISDLGFRLAPCLAPGTRVHSQINAHVRELKDAVRQERRERRRMERRLGELRALAEAKKSSTAAAAAAAL